MRSRIPAPRPAWLTVVHSPDASALGRRLDLDRSKVLTLGRGASSHATIADPRLSREHANVAFDPRELSFRIGDGHSRNGTFVDAQLVQSQVLRPNTVIRVGDTLLVYAEDEGNGSVTERIAQVASTELSVLLLGETGTGKEVQARKLHELSGRRGAFVAVNCASIPREVIAAELFGHTRGAFSGATRDRPGLFRAADGGTILLDEIGDMPADLQAALLRVLQEKQVRPVGADHDVPVQIRVLAATHANLEERMQDGSFRLDLFARLSQVIVRLPPLRERRAEILSLARELGRARGRALSMSSDAAEALLCWSWPLNIRELESLVALFAATGGKAVELDVDFLFASKPEIFDDAETTASEDKEPEAASRLEVITAALQQSGGKMAVAARRLGVSRQKLYRLMKASGLNPDDFREDLL